VAIVVGVKTWDPEGLFHAPRYRDNTPWVLAGEWLRRTRKSARKALGLVIAGCRIDAGGQLLHPISRSTRICGPHLCLFTPRLCHATAAASVYCCAICVAGEVGRRRSCVRHERDLAYALAAIVSEISIASSFDSPVAACELARLVLRQVVSFRIAARRMLARVRRVLCRADIRVLWPLYRKKIFVRI